MIPFAYDSKRSFSVGSILFLTIAASIRFFILRPDYLANYQPGEYLLIMVPTVLAVNGIMTWLIRIASNNIELGDWKKPAKSEGNELDFD